MSVAALRKLPQAALDLASAALACAAPAALVVALRGSLDDLLAGRPRLATALYRSGFLLACLAGYWACVRWRERRFPTELMPRLRSALLGALGGSLLIGVPIAALLAAGQYRVLGYRGFGEAGGVIGLILVAATLEELFYRAVAFRILERHFGTLPALIVGALVFGAMHLENEGARAVTLVSVSVLGILWTGVFVLTHDLWATALHHAAWNLTIFAAGVPLSGSTEFQALAPLDTETVGSELWTGGVFGPEDSPASIALTSLACVLVFRRAVRTGRWVPLGGGGQGTNDSGVPSSAR